MRSFKNEKGMGDMLKITTCPEKGNVQSITTKEKSSKRRMEKSIVLYITIKKRNLLCRK